MATPAKIYISYRRNDDPAAAGRLSDALTRKLRGGSPFIDTQSLRAGQRFDEELAKALATCDVLIAIIGARWMELLDARRASGERDYVREEIAKALQRKITVIPVRVGSADGLPSLPRPEALPDDIRDLLLYQKQDVTNERFDRDISDLASAIDSVRGSKPPFFGVRGWALVAAATALLVLASLTAYPFLRPAPAPGDPSQISKMKPPAQTAENRTLEVQRKLKTLGLYNGSLDGSEGPQFRGAVMEFQRRYNLEADGEVGPFTYLAIMWAGDANPSFPPGPTPEKPDLDKSQINAIQLKLKILGLFDGPFDDTMNPKLRSAVAEFQRQNGLTADGEVGPITYSKIIAATIREKPSAPAK